MTTKRQKQVQQRLTWPSRTRGVSPGRKAAQAAILYNYKSCLGCADFALTSKDEPCAECIRMGGKQRYRVLTPELLDRRARVAELRKQKG